NEHEFPPAKLGAVAEVEVFGQGVVLPTAGIVDRRSTPDAGCAVEVEESSAPVPAAMLEDEMPVQEDRLNFGQERVVLVDVPPSGLDHADVRVPEMGHQPAQEIGAGNEIGVENRDELPARDGQPRFERARLVSVTVPPVVVLDVN